MPHKTQIAGFALAVIAFSAGSASAQLTIEVKDYLTMPKTGLLNEKAANDVFFARVNALKEEPGGATRLFVPDQNGPLYILDKATQKLTTYLDFNGRDTRPGMFHRFSYEQGYGVGLNSLVIDPDYRRNGKFYTVHDEETSLAGSSVPDNKNFPGLSPSTYVPTAMIGSPGQAVIEGVIVEWTDTNISNSTFEGTAREILRVQLTGRAHPTGELIFNPTARPGDADWRVMYIGQGDSASGESKTPFQSNPQRLDTLLGKVLRIIPDLNEHTMTSTVSDNGRYRIPNDNPFVSTAGARKEIWAYGFRNPPRLGRGSRQPVEQPSHRELGRPAHVGDRLSREEGRQLRLRRARRHRAAQGRQHDRPAACDRQDSTARRRSRDGRDGDADLSGHPVRARTERRRFDWQRV